MGDTDDTDLLIITVSLHSNAKGLFNGLASHNTGTTRGISTGSGWPRLQSMLIFGKLINTPPVILICTSMPCEILSRQKV
jgi:putative effector of murein hydrolase